MTQDVKDTMFVVCWVGMILCFGFMAGRIFEWNRAECFCGQEQACAFGAGIVGKQGCGVDRTWKPCDPDPKYKAGGF